MEAAVSSSVEIRIAGKNVTGDVGPYLAKVRYTDRVEAESDDIALDFEDTGGKWHGSWYPQQGDTLSVKITSDGKALDCGLFEIDEVELELAPDVLTVKGIAVPIAKSLRTKNSKAFEKQTLREVAQYIADKHGLKMVGSVGAMQEVEIERKTQDGQTDMSFLAGLAKEYGVTFSVRGAQLVFMDVSELEAAASVMAISREQLSRGHFRDKTSHVYSGAKVTKRDMRTNKLKTWETVKSVVEGVKDTLIINKQVDSDEQAKAKAEKALEEKNREKITGTITVAGHVKLVAGVNVDLTGLGKLSGKWHVVSSTHTVEPETGYVTEAEVRKIMV
jgi:phage protein D